MSNTVTFERARWDSDEFPSSRTCPCWLGHPVHTRQWSLLLPCSQVTWVSSFPVWFQQSQGHGLSFLLVPLGCGGVFSICNPVQTRSLPHLLSQKLSAHEWTPLCSRSTGCCPQTPSNLPKGKYNSDLGQNFYLQASPAGSRQGHFSDMAVSSWGPANMLALGLRLRGFPPDERGLQVFCISSKVLISFLGVHLFCKIFAKIAPSPGTVSFCYVSVLSALFLSLGRDFFGQ